MTAKLWAAGRRAPNLPLDSRRSCDSRPADTTDFPHSWVVVDHDRDDKIVRGPYQTAETAGAVRRELETLHSYYRENGNLWIIPVSSVTTSQEQA